MDAVRLKARSWVGPGIAAIQQIGIASAGLDAVDDSAKIPRRIALHLDRFRERASGGQREINVSSVRRPHHELPTSIRNAGRPQSRWANGLRVAQAVEVKPLRILTLSISTPPWMSPTKTPRSRQCRRDTASLP